PRDEPWVVYRANARLDQETDFWELRDIPAMPAADEVLPDPNGSSNTFYAYHSDMPGDKFRWRYDLSSEDTTMTLVTRFKAIDPGVNGIIYLEPRAFGWRQKIRINQSTIKMERADPVVEAATPFNWNDEMHLLRMVVDGPETRIYLDENPEPFLVGTSSTEDNSSFFEYGKSGGDDYGAIIDWIAIDLTGAYAPGEGTPLPEDLFLSSDATLSLLAVDGLEVAGFEPYVFDYTLSLETSELPELSWTTTSQLATAVAESPSNPEGDQATVTVTAQDGLTIRTYTLNYLLVNIDEQELADWLKIFPNPASDYLQVALPPGEQAAATIFSAEGQLLKQGLRLADQARWDVSDLPAGIYLLRVEWEDSRLQFYKLIIQ
ncbi:MAG: T9SS C-terminal target domain-containing protein, partial [Bacteroidetes bacterium]